MAREIDRGMLEFLRAIASWGGKASSSDLHLPGMNFTTREQDKARQRCRRRKLAHFESGYYWTITDAGREAIA